MIVRASERPEGEARDFSIRAMAERTWTGATTSPAAHYRKPIGSRDTSLRSSMFAVDSRSRGRNTMAHRLFNL
jgi:hypothetical protein